MPVHGAIQRPSRHQHGHHGHKGGHPQKLGRSGGSGATDSKRSLGKKKITFINGENLVSPVYKPPKSDNNKLWFTETEKIVSKPIHFVLEPGRKVNIDIGINVQLTTLVADNKLTLQRQKKLKKKNKKDSQRGNVDAAEVVGDQQSASLEVLEVNDENSGLLNDEMNSTDHPWLSRLLGDSPEMKRIKAKKAKKVKWLSGGTVRVGRPSRINVRLTRGSYWLRNSSESVPLAVFGQAADSERTLA